MSANNLFGGGPRFAHDAGTSVPHTCTFVTYLSEPIQVGASSPGRFMSQIVATDGGSIPCSSVRPAPHAAVSVVVQESEHFTSFSSTPQNYGDAQRLSRFKVTEETPFPSGGSPARSVLSMQNFHGRRIPYGLRGGPSRTPSLWRLTEIQRLARQVLLWAQTKFLTFRAVHVPGHLNSGILALESGGRTPRSGCSCPRMAQDQSLCFFPDLITARSSVQSTVGQGVAFAVGGPTVAQSVVVLKPGQSASRPSLGGSTQTQSVDTSPRHDLASLTGIMVVKA
ncbi:hypothetical protein H4Q32_009729 [Labeo rohita]|uniref:Uncharacterized protein n=1 Tax=Labeo rohita TaxID=84645 RepID=A0ABQ8MT44_LABRO|nr:hypothetical protein H4Q32_009729 [Labeo rohita]